MKAFLLGIAVDALQRRAHAFDLISPIASGGRYPRHLLAMSRQIGAQLVE
jgi:hypothetical protein